MSPKGPVLKQSTGVRLAAGYDQLIILCGHYEGVDCRIVDEIVDEELSIGDYVLTGGEMPACVVIDAVARMLPGVLSDPACYEHESFFTGILEEPQYTHPVVFHGVRVPDVLLTGNHKDIDKWRYSAALEITMRNRPDLLK